MNHFDYNHTTGETTLVSFSEEQVEEAQARHATFLARKEEMQQKLLSDEAIKASAKAKLAALGLTEEEIEALVLR